MSGLDETARAYLQEGGRAKSYPDGAIIVHRGRPGEAFYLLTSGDAEVQLGSADGRQLPLSLLVLAAGPFMAFHLDNVPALAAVQLHLPSGLIDETAAGPAHVSLATILQFAAVLTAAVLAAIALWRVRAHLVARGTAPPRRGWRIVRALCLAYVLAAMALVTLKGLHA